MNFRLMNTTFVLILFISSLTVTKCEPSKIKFGTSLSSQSSEPFDIAASKLMENIYKFFEYWVNNEYDFIINGTHYDFEFIVYHDDKSESKIKENYEKLINEDEVNLLFGGTSVLSYNIAGELAEKNTLPILVFSPYTPIYVNKTTVFNVYPNPYSQLYDILPMLRISGVKSIHVLDMSTNIQACYNNDEIFKINNIEDVEVTIYDDTDENLAKTIDKVIELDKDLLIYCNMNQTNFNEVARLLYEKQYVPRGGLNLMMDKYLMDKNYTDYWMMFHYYVEEIEYPNTKFIGNYTNLKSKMLKFINDYPEYTMDPDSQKATLMLIYSMVEIAFNGIMSARELNGYNIIDSIRRSKYDSLVGQISYTSDNMHLISGIGYQMINSELNNLLLPNILSNASIVYPAPTYIERIKSTKVTKIEIAVYVFVGITIINSIVWIIYIILNMKNERLVSSSPIFLIGMLVGSIILSISLIMWSPTILTSSMCYLLPILISIGFTLLFGSVLVKTWRIHLIFSEKSFEVFKISNRKVLFFLSILLLIDIVLLSIWASISKTKLYENIIDKYRISENYNTCRSNTGGHVLIWIIVGYKVLQILYGGYLALRVRTIPLKQYDESKIIAMCIYIISIAAIITAALQGSAPTNRYVLFGINSFIILFSVLISINLMLIAKVKYINKLSSSSNGSSNLSSMSLSQMTPPNIVKENENLLKENSKLKKENKNLHSKLKKLENQLNTEEV